MSEPDRRPAAATAGIIVIGDEILSGKTADVNCNFLIGQLRELGVGLRRIAVIPDVLDDIETTVRWFAARFEHVFTSGGVGPTHDDLTMEGVARAFDTKVVRDPRLEGILRQFYGEKLEARNLRMADIPEGAQLILGEGLAWPVVAYDNVYILPGVPEIFQRKFLGIRERFRVAPYHLKCVYTVDEEGGLAAHLDYIVARHPGVAVGSYPRIAVGTGMDRWRVKVTLESKDAELVRAAAAELAERLGPESVVKVD